MKNLLQPGQLLSGTTGLEMSSNEKVVSAFTQKYLELRRLERLASQTASSLTSTWAKSTSSMAISIGISLI